MPGTRSSVCGCAEPGESHRARVGKERAPKPCVAVKICISRLQQGSRTTSDNPMIVSVVVPGYADPDVLDILRDSPPECRESVGVLLSISASSGREDCVLEPSGAREASVKGEFQEKSDRVLHCWPPRIGPSPGKLLIYPQRSVQVDRRAKEAVGNVLENVRFSGFKKQQMCLGLFALCDEKGMLCQVARIYYELLKSTKIPAQDRVCHDKSFFLGMRLLRFLRNTTTPQIPEPPANIAEPPGCIFVPSLFCCAICALSSMCAYCLCHLGVCTHGPELP